MHNRCGLQRTSAIEPLERRRMLSVEPLINLATKTAGSSPANFAAFDGQAVFTASGASGNEPYITDGTRQGTRLLLDISPGTNGSAASKFFAIGRKLFFTAISPGIGNELWASDGTTAGTHLVADLTPSSGSSTVSRFTAFNDKLFFVLNNNLWQSDGTSGGTSQVWSNLAGYQPVVFKDQLYFVSNEGSVSRLRAVAGDGSIRLVTNAKVEPDFDVPTKLFVFKNHLYFPADTGTGYELHRTDGTEAGTSVFFEGNSNGSSSPKLLEASGGRMYFTARLTGTLSGTLFFTDGTTITQTSLAFGGSSSAPFSYTSWNGLLFYNYQDLSGDEPWVTDGTAAGTKRLLDIAAGSASSLPSQFQVIDDVVYFVTRGGVSFWYSTDGTSAGTKRFLEGYLPTSPKTLSGKMIASLNVDEYGAEPFAFNPANDDFELLRDLNTKSVAPSIGAYFTAGGMTYFSVDSQVWRTNGTSTGTIPLNISGNVSAAKVGPDGKSYLLAGNRLYITDGTAANSTQLASFPNTATHMMFLGDLVIVLTNIGQGSPLYSVNRDTGQVTLLAPLAAASNSVMSTMANGKVFITSKVESARIFQTDGTPSGTTNFEELPSNSQGFFGSIGYTSVAAYIVPIDFGSLKALYRVDGTPAGSYNLLSGISSATSGALIFKDQLITFIGDGLYRTNASQTALIRVGTFSGSVGTFGDADARAAATDDQVFFFAGLDSSSISGLWKTDGTGANPSLVTNLNLPINLPKRLFGTSHTLYFDDGENVYTSDGTAVGTVIVPGVRQTGYAASRAAIGDWLITYDAQDAYRLLRIGDGPSAAIEGSLFFDDNGDAEQNANEDPATARTLFIDLNSNGLLDADEPRQTNNAASGFRFGGLSAGTYTVRALLQPGETQTSGLGSITLSGGQLATIGMGIQQADVLPPTLLLQKYDVDNAAVELTFDADISLSSNAVITLENRATNAMLAIPQASITISNDWNRVTIALPAGLPDGNYRLGLSEDALLDGNSNGSVGISQEFFVLAADATRDRQIDTADFNVLAASFGGSGKTFSQGNFNQDAFGTVDSQDFNVLLAQYGKRLTLPASPVAVTAASIFGAPAANDEALEEWN